MSDQSTLAAVFLGFGGNTLYTLGTALTSVGVLFGIHRVTGHGITAINQLPYWLGMKEMNKDEQGITRAQIFNELQAYTKVGGVLVAGVVIKATGKYLNMDTTVQTFNQMLYK
jgi:hypothetical protein